MTTPPTQTNITTSENASSSSLDDIIKRHTEWVKAGCDPDKPGRADLRGRTFSDVPLRTALAGKDLRDAIFTNANLSGADLTKTDLRGAELDGANLTNCDLCDTRFEGANLKKADLTGAKNLTSRQFGGADLERIQFPAGFALDGAGQVDEWLKGANSLYLLYLSLCLFSVIVAFSTSEVQIVTETGTAKLPLIDIQLPILWFFFLAPGLISIVYLAFRLNLLRACEGMAELPAVYADGQTIHKKVHPLLINSIFLSRLPRLQNKHPELYLHQTWITTFTVFVVPHLTLLAIWGRFLLRQEWLGSVFHLGTYLFTAIVGLGYGLENKELIRRKLTTSVKGMFSMKYWRATVFSVVAFTCVLLYLTLGSFGYISFGKFKKNETVAKWILGRVTLHPEARVEGEDISQGKPTNWNNEVNSNRAGVALVQGAKLSNRRLRKMKAKEAFLVKANMVNADLEGADLSRASLQLTNLRGADFRNAKLKGAFLYKADASPYSEETEDESGKSGASPADERKWSARFNCAELNEAKMIEMVCKYANFSDAKLPNADLTGAILINSLLIRANLKGAALVGANLTGADLTGATLTGAKYNTGKNPTKWPTGFDYRGAGAIEVDEKGNEVK